MLAGKKPDGLTELAKLTLSGEKFEIGTNEDIDGTNIYIRIMDCEAVYLSIPDTDLLMAALALAKFEAKGEVNAG